jgi:hypothetical protein
METQVARRPTGLLTASLSSAVMLSAAACTSGGGPPTGTPTPLSLPQVLPLFLQCLVDHHVTIWDRAQGDTNAASIGEKAGWLVNGRVVANQNLYTRSDAIEGFSPMSPDFEPQQTIATWLDDAVSKGTWPKVCPPLP